MIDMWNQSRDINNNINIERQEQRNNRNSGTMENKVNSTHGYRSNRNQNTQNNQLKNDAACADGKIQLRRNQSVQQPKISDSDTQSQRLSYNELRNSCPSKQSALSQRRFSFNAGRDNSRHWLSVLNKEARVKSSESVVSTDDRGSEIASQNSRNQPVDVLVSNLDYNIASKEWKKILLTHFRTSVEVLDITMENLADDTLAAIVRLGNMNDARLAISQFHRKKIGYKRIQVQLHYSSLSSSSSNQLRLKQEVRALLNSVSGKQLPVTKFLELFELRYHRSLALAELFKLKDVCEIKENPAGGRVVILTSNSSYLDNVDIDIEPQVCGIHCRDGTLEYMQALDAGVLPCVLLSLKTFKHQVHKLLQQHNGLLPVASFPACYKAEFGPLSVVKDHPLVGGVYLEHLIAAVSGVRIVSAIHGSKTIAWDEQENLQNCNTLLSTTDLNSSSGTNAASKEQKLHNEQMLQFSREVVDLLRLQVGSRLLLSKFIPTYHHQFGRQCRVADYGYSKLAELLAAFPNTVEILGTGPVKILTLTHKIQVRRFTSDIIKILKFAPGKSCKASELPYYYQKLFHRSFVISDYGICYLEDLLEELPEGTIEISNVDSTPDLLMSLPQRAQTTSERTRTSQFAIEVMELLRHSPRCRIPFARFIPSFHHFYGRQVRVSDFGFSKLVDLLEALPALIRITEDMGEKYVCLTRRLQIKVFAEHTLNILEGASENKLSPKDFVMEYMRQQGTPFYASDFVVASLQELIGKIPKVATISYDKEGSEFVSLADRKEVLSAANLVLAVMLDKRVDSMSETEFIEACGSKINLLWLQDELKEIIHVLPDPMKCTRRVMLQPIVSFSRDLRNLLRSNQGRIAFNAFESVYESFFGVKLNPLAYGYPSVSSLISQVPFVCQLRGRGIRSTLLLCDDLISQLAYKVAYSTDPTLTDIDDQLDSQEALLSRYPTSFSSALDLSPCRLLPVTPVALNETDTGKPLYITPTTPSTSPLTSPTLPMTSHADPASLNPYSHNNDGLRSPVPMGVWGSSDIASPSLNEFTPVKQMIRGLQMDMAFSDQTDQMQKLINELMNCTPERKDAEQFNVRAN